jgi:uncharacterized protein (TIGR00369 family)
MSEADKNGFSLEEARHLLADAFARCVVDLGISVENIDAAGAGHPEGLPGAVLRMAFSERLCREGGIVCGQAMLALADTAMVFAVSAASGKYRPMTTVDQSTHFLKPAAKADIVADARIVRLGRTMSFGRVTLTSAADGKPVAMASSAYAML